MLRSFFRRAMTGAILLVGAFGQMPSVNADAVRNDGPIVIAHRGASGYRPEHTLMSYGLAVQQGADYVEPDLVMTKDGYLVARHDIYLSDSTNVADVADFADRKRTFEGLEDWFVFDFTLAELQTLGARQPRPARGTEYDGEETVLTFDDIITFAEKAKAGGYKGGFYIEMKSPKMFRGKGLDPMPGLLDGFTRLRAAGIPLYFQCFESDFLLEFGARMDVPLIWLIEGIQDSEHGPYHLEVPIELMAGKIDGLGLNKALLVGENGLPNDLVERAHGLGMLVHVWTIRDDQVAPGFTSSTQELKMLFGMGVDGVFSDFPDTAINARQSFLLAAGGLRDD